MTLNIGLNSHSGVQRSGHVLFVGHDSGSSLGLGSFGLSGLSLHSSSGSLNRCSGGLGCFFGLGTASESQNHAQNQQHCNDLFHVSCLLC